MKAILEVHDLLVERGNRPILNVASLAIEEGETLAIIGPNGDGKSTLLLTLSRLLPPTRGEISFRGQSLAAQKALAYRRRIALVLQEPLLLDVTVFENVAAGLRFRHLPKGEKERRTLHWLCALGIEHLRQRRPRTLSGGEAQRVSLARAFALQPELLLLDEPFSALDAPTRTRLLQDLQNLLAETEITTIFVTHDLNEALQLGDRVAVLLNGRLRQCAPPQQVFSAPADEEVAAFVGMDTVIAGQVIASQAGQVIVQANGLHLEAVGDFATGKQVLFCLRPEDVTLWPKDHAHPSISSARNRLSGRIARLMPNGPLVRVIVDCGFPLTALITRASMIEMGLSENQAVTATFKASAAHLIPR